MKLDIDLILNEEGKLAIAIGGIDYEIVASLETLLGDRLEAFEGYVDECDDKDSLNKEASKIHAINEMLNGLKEQVHSFHRNTIRPKALGLAGIPDTGKKNYLFTIE